MRRPELLALAADLARRGVPFAIATVVRREPPSSARTGDSALIARDGTFHGWLGGSCTQPTVLREAARSIADGRPRLVALSPEPDASPRPGVVSLPMTCHSGGSVDVYIEPVLPAPALLVFGASPVARALVPIARVLDHAAFAVDPDADAGAFPQAALVATDYGSAELAERLAGLVRPAAAVVATIGVRDEEALGHALRMTSGYVGLVASRRRFGEIREILVGSGLPEEDLDRVKCPAGLDLGAVSPAEIALSIMAEIVERERATTPEEGAMAAAASAPAPAGRAPAERGLPLAGRPAAPAAPAAPAGAGAVAIDPVCGMSVEVATAKHRAEHEGRAYVFCCGGCRARFAADPTRYLAGAGEGAEGGSAGGGPHGAHG